MNEGYGDGPIDIAYTDGEVIADSRGAPAEAILIREGRIAAVGTNDEVLAAAGSGVERQSLDGATVIPGLIDTHPHLAHISGFAAHLVDIMGARNHDEIVAAIREKAEQTPKGEWILTTPVGEPHYFQRRSYRDLAEGELPDRRVLDLATLEHPVAIQAWAPVMPNVMTMNSAALEAVGIDASTPDRVCNVWIEKDDGVPTGVLRGAVNCTAYNFDPFFLGLLEKMPPLVQPELAPGALIQAMADYNAQGITAIYEGHAMDFPLIELYQALRAQGLLSLRVQAAVEIESGALPGDKPKSQDEVRETLERALEIRTLDDDWLRVDGVTASGWGPVYCGCMFWSDGYQDPWGQTTIGRRSMSEQNTQLAVDFCADRGLRLNFCAVSPDETDEYLELTAQAMRKYGLDRTDWVIQHGYLMREDQAKLLAEKGFDMTISMSFTFGKGDILAERIGPEVLQYLNPLRHLLDAGLTVAASMDWGPTNPFEQMQLAVTHQMVPSGRYNAGEAQVISRAEAFEMWTANGAKLLGWDGIGGLTPGNHADIAILDRNPVTCDLDALPSTRVLRTHVGGRIVHDDGSLALQTAPTV